MLDGAPLAHRPQGEHRDHTYTDRAGHGPEEADAAGQGSAVVGALEVGEPVADEAPEEPAEEDRPEGQDPGSQRRQRAGGYGLYSSERHLELGTGRLYGKDLQRTYHRRPRLRRGGEDQSYLEQSDRR